MPLRNSSFLSRAGGYFSPPQLLTIQKSQIRPSLEYCSHTRGGAPKSSLHLLDKSNLKQSVSSTIKSSPILSSLFPIVVRLQILPFFLPIFSWTLEIKNIIPGPVRRRRTTRSSTHTHPFQVTQANPRTLAQKSSFIRRTSQLWNTLASSAFPESYNLSSFKSNINKLNLISLFT